MIRPPAALALLPLLAIVAGCSEEAMVGDDDAARSAGGEVLEGSISDAMLPLEDLTSQPPVAAPLPGEVVAAPAGGPGEPAAASDSGETPAAGGSSEAAPAQAPASEPAPPQ